MGILPLRNALVALREAPLPNLRANRTSFTFYEGAKGIPESNAPDMFNRSWQLHAHLKTADHETPAQGVIATVGGTVSGWSLFLDEKSRPVFEYRVFEAGHLRIVGEEPLSVGEHQLTVDFAYDGEGYAKGGLFTLKTGKRVLGQQRVEVTPPAFYSIDETFDLGVDTGSPAGQYPTNAAIGFPFTGGRILRVGFDSK